MTRTLLRKQSLFATILVLTSPSFVFSQETTIVSEATSSTVDVTTSIPQGQRIVELCICLDTSGSMDGLINSARQKLWSIVNDLALARPTPRLRLALLSYGNDGNAQENGWVKVETPFTEDLDKVSEMLFALTTNGGTELVGRVMQTGIQELDWTPSEDVLKLMFVAGNESADQDSEAPFREIAKQVIGQGIMINSIYCVYPGDSGDIQPAWEEIARLADGQFATIDQNSGSVTIATPFDRALIDLSSALNETYIPFGAEGARGVANQVAQDVNAVGLNFDAAAGRAQTKAGALYACSWDLCDALRLEDVNLAEVKTEDLPEIMQDMTLQERENYVAAMRAKRGSIQKQINNINAQRQQLVIIEQQRMAQRGVDGFDLAVRNAIREQARTKGYSYAPMETTNPGEAPQAVYLVKVGQNWVSSNFVNEYEATLQRNVSSLEIAAELDYDSATDESIIQSFSEPLQKSIESSVGTIFVLHDGKVYQIHRAAPQEEASQVEDQTDLQNAQQLIVPQQTRKPIPEQSSRSGGGC